MQAQQIEIDFTEPPILCSRGQGQPRLTRARWWFAQMRRVVDQAWDWNAEPRARPEQTYLELARLQGEPGNGQSFSFLPWVAPSTTSNRNHQWRSTVIREVRSSAFGRWGAKTTIAAKP